MPQSIAFQRHFLSLVSGVFHLSISSAFPYLISMKQQGAVAPLRKLKEVSRVADEVKRAAKDTYLNTTS